MLIAVAVFLVMRKTMHQGLLPASGFGFNVHSSRSVDKFMAPRASTDTIVQGDLPLSHINEFAPRLVEEEGTDSLQASVLNDNSHYVNHVQQVTTGDILSRNEDEVYADPNVTEYDNPSLLIPGVERGDCAKSVVSSECQLDLSSLLGDDASRNAGGEISTAEAFVYQNMALAVE